MPNIFKESCIMMRWADLKMQTKLFVLSMIGIISMVVIGCMGSMYLRHDSQTLKEINSSVQHVTRFGEMKSQFLTARLDLVYMMSLRDPAKLKEKLDDYNAQMADIQAALKTTPLDELDAKEKELVIAINSGVEAYQAEGRKLGEMLLAAHSADDATALAAAVKFGSEQVAPLYAKPAAAIKELNALNVRDSKEMYEAAESQIGKAITLFVIIVGLAIIASLVTSTLIARGISRSLANVFDTMAAIAEGDLTVSSTITSADEMGMLGREMNIMRQKLTDIVKRLADNSHSVSSAAIQMHSTAEQMATSTEELAAQATTIATASEEMSATSGSIAVNCHHAADDSARANTAAEMGVQVVEITVNVMSKIAERVRSSAQTVESLGARSDQIGQIIGTIEDIADQTNLLALNAAIEAARAGEQGRGFAVVADEVRALAERTTKATREIGDMIKTIQVETKDAVSAMNEGVSQVEQGTAEAAKSGEALRHILEQISSVTSQVNQIAVAAEEQTATTMEINHNVQQISEVARMTSSSSHEEAAAANQLARLAEDLKSMVQQFKYA
jgi:methyl-accepting chemotaxis protein